VVVAPGADGHEWGLVTDLDLAAAVVDGSLVGVAAGQIASTPSVVVGPDDTLSRAAQLMRDYETHHLVVLQRGREHPVGIVSTLDLADVVAELPKEPGSDLGRPR
jgi:CBS domain-containing protein